MLNPNIISEISNKIKELINNSPVADLEKNVNALLKGAFTKMELVSREEFDIQAEVLRNARQKLEELEAKLASLEAQMTSDKESNKP
ncbi:MAG TPA: accessory factor UbiK family protein [Methylotenera sp.]|nr:accessory factor UbiK family protein [Methylotenera sp.]